MAKPQFFPKIKAVEEILLPQIKPSCGPLFLTTSLERAKGNVADSASFGLIYTGKKTLLVTCYHVWNDFVARREKNPDFKLCTCLDQKTPIELCTLFDGTKLRPIDQNKELDIATFDFTPFLSACTDQHFFRIGTGEENQLKEQDPVAIIGYPGKHRSEWDDGIKYGRVPYLGFAASISGHKIMVDFTRMMSQQRELTIKKGDDKNALGGVSGGPCFLVKRDYEPVLIGFVTEHINFSMAEVNFLQITSSKCIDENGKITPSDSFCR